MSRRKKPRKGHGINMHVGSVRQLEQLAKRDNSVKAAMLAEEVRACRDKPCIRCGKTAGNAMIFTMNSRVCAVLDMQVDAKGDGPTTLMPICLRCSALLTRDDTADDAWHEILTNMITLKAMGNVRTYG